MRILRSPWDLRRADGSPYGFRLSFSGSFVPIHTIPTEATSSDTALGSTSMIASLTVDPLPPTGASNSTDPAKLPLHTGVPSITTITLVSAVISTTSAPSPNGDTPEAADTTTAGSAPSTDWFAPTDSVSSSTSWGNQPGTTMGTETTLVQVVSTVSVFETPWTTSVWLTPLGSASTTAGPPAGSSQRHTSGQSAAMVVAICIAVGVAFLLGVAGWRLRVLRRRRMEADDGTDDMGDGVRLWQEKEAGETGVNAADGLLLHEGQQHTVLGHSVLSPGLPSRNGGDQYIGADGPNPDTRLDDGAGSCASSTFSYINTLCPETASSRRPNSPATYNPQILSVLPPILPTEARVRPLPAPTMPPLGLPLPARPMYALSPEERASVWSMMNVRDSGIDEVFDVYHEEFDLRPPEYSRY